MTWSAASRQTLRDTIQTQRLGCELAGSPLYAQILDVMADDLARGGPFDRLLEPVADAPFGDAVLLRALAALHALVLEGRAPALAEHYPSMGGRPGPGLASAVLATAEDHHGELADGMAIGVQTNEVGRSASLLGGYLEVARGGLPLRVLEIGASAGLNLLFDRFHYRQGDRSFGPVDSPLVFHDPWHPTAPDLEVPLRVASRRGCDVAPIDPTSPTGRLRLRSFVWADQPERMARLDAALACVGDEPPPVDASPAPEWLAARLAEPEPGCFTVVTHSIVLQYLVPGARRRAVAEIESAGLRARPDAPLGWLRLEPGGDQAELRLTTWPGGRTNRLATSAYHGPPVVWRGRGVGAGGTPR